MINAKWNVWWPHAEKLVGARTKESTSGTSDTYQATGVYVGKLHVLTSNVDLLIAEGTGSSVTSTSGYFWPAGVPLEFRPVTGTESIGYTAFDGNALSATRIVHVACRDTR